MQSVSVAREGCRRAVWESGAIERAGVSSRALRNGCVTCQWVCNTARIGTARSGFSYADEYTCIDSRTIFLTELILREMAGPLISLYTSIALLHAPLSVPSLSRCPAPRCAEGDSLFSAFANLFKEDPDAAARKE